MPKKHHHHSRLYGARVERALEKASPIEGLTEREFMLDRIAGGSPLSREADRLGLSEGSLRAYINRNEDLRAEYQTARERGSESVVDYVTEKSMELLSSHYTDDETGERKPWNAAQVKAREAGMKQMSWLASKHYKSTYGDYQITKQEVGLSDDLRARLDAIAEQKQKEAELLAQPLKIIDGEVIESRDD